MKNNKIIYNNRGFSLMEIMVVVVIMGLLAALVGPRLFGHLDTAQQKAAKSQVQMLMTALDAYRLDVGSYPSQQEGLEALVSNPGVDGWLGPYLNKSTIPEDPWKHPYVYQNPGQKGEVDISSLGGDNKEGGEGKNADINSWE